MVVRLPRRERTVGTLEKERAWLPRLAPFVTLAAEGRPTEAWKVLSADSRDIFRTALSIDDATWARGRGWALSQALGALSYDTLETNPVLVREARRWMVDVLTA